MSIIRYVEDVLYDCVSDRLRRNKDHSALDHYEFTFMSSIAANRYHNENFKIIADGIVDRLDMLEDYNNMDFEQNPSKFVNEFLDLMMADHLTKESESIVSSFSSRDYDFIQSILDSELYDLVFGGSRYSRRSERDDRYGRDYRGRRDRGRDSGYRDDRDDRYGRDRYDDRYDDRYRDRRGGFGGGGRADYGYDRPVRDNAHRTKRSASESNGYLVMARNERHQQDDSRDDRSRPSRDTGYGRERPQESPQSRQEGHVQSDFDRWNNNVDEETRSRPINNGKVVLTPPPRELQGYDFTSEAPYESFWEDDRHWEASTITKRQLTGYGCDRFPSLYNIFQHVSYHVMDKFGNVTQEFKPVTNDNRYINQSLLRDQDNYTEAFGRKPKKVSEILDTADTADVEVDQLESVQPQEREFEDVIDISQDDLDRITHVIPSDGLASSAIEARSKLDAIPDKHSMINTFMLMDPVESASETEAKTIRNLYNQSSLITLSKALLDMRPHTSKANWKRINDKLTKRVLSVINDVYGLDVKAMNFAEHWPSIVEHVSKNHKRYSREWVADFVRGMNSLIPTLLNLVDVCDEDGKINEVFTHIVTEHNRNRVVAFVDFYVMISLDCTLDQLSIGRQLEAGEPVVLRMGDDLYGAESFHSVLAEIEQCREQLLVSQLLVSTRCGALISVRLHELTGPNLLLSLFDPHQ